MTDLANRNSTRDVWPWSWVSNAHQYDRFFEESTDFFSKVAEAALSMEHGTTETYDSKTGNRTIQMDLPGVKKADLGVSLDEGVVTIQAKRGENVITKKIWVGDVGPPAAKLEDGVLTLSIKGKRTSRVNIPIE